MGGWDEDDREEKRGEWVRESQKSESGYEERVEVMELRDKGMGEWVCGGGGG